MAEAGCGCGEEMVPEGGSSQKGHGDFHFHFVEDTTKYNLEPVAEVTGPYQASQEQTPRRWFRPRAGCWARGSFWELEAGPRAALPSLALHDFLLHTSPGRGTDTVQVTARAGVSSPKRVPRGQHPREEGAAPGEARAQQLPKHGDQRRLGDGAGSPGDPTGGRPGGPGRGAPGPSASACSSPSGARSLARSQVLSNVYAAAAMGLELTTGARSLLHLPAGLYIRGNPSCGLACGTTAPEAPPEPPAARRRPPVTASSGATRARREPRGSRCLRAGSRRLSQSPFTVAFYSLSNVTVTLPVFPSRVSSQTGTLPAPLLCP